MKILVLNGSPKREASDTMHVTRAFLAGMEEAAAQEVRILHAVDQHIWPALFLFIKHGGVDLYLSRIWKRYEKCRLFL